MQLADTMDKRKNAQSENNCQMEQAAARHLSCIGYLYFPRNLRVNMSTVEINKSESCFCQPSKSTNQLMSFKSSSPRALTLRLHRPKLQYRLQRNNNVYAYKTFGWLYAWPK